MRLQINLTDMHLTRDVRTGVLFLEANINVFGHNVIIDIDVPKCLEKSITENFYK